MTVYGWSCLFRLLMSSHVLAFPFYTLAYRPLPSRTAWLYYPQVKLFREQLPPFVDKPHSSQSRRTISYAFPLEVRCIDGIQVGIQSTPRFGVR